MHRQAVEVSHWMSDADFAALFAIAQAAPGPNFMIATLVGFKAAGLAPLTVGLVAATAYLLIRAADRDWRLAAVTTVAGGSAYFTRLNPLWCLAAAAGLGLAGALS